MLTDIISWSASPMAGPASAAFRRDSPAEIDRWLEEQKDAGRIFTEEQLEWLAMIRDHIATSLEIEKDDFELAPFHKKVVLAKVYTLFGEDLDKILDELNEVLVA